MYIVTTTLTRVTTSTQWYDDFNPVGYQGYLDYITTQTGFISLTDARPDDFTRVRVTTFDNQANYDAFMSSAYRSEELLDLMTYIFQEGIQIDLKEPE